MASTAPTDVLANLPQEITFLILEHLKWPETLPLRNLNKQWREFMDYHFVRAAPSCLRLGKDNRLKLHALSRWTRHIALSKKHISKLQNWRALSSHLPRIMTLSISFHGVRYRTACAIMSDLGRFGNLSTLALEGTTFHEIHQLIPSLSRTCINLQDLRIHIVPANYETFQHNTAWLQRTLVVHDMPQLHSLDLEFIVGSEVYDWELGRELCTRINGELHRPIIQLITSAINLETLKIQTRPAKGSVGELDSYASCLCHLHETNPKLQTAHLKRLQILGYPALAAVSLTVENCTRPQVTSHFTKADLKVDYDAIWNSKLRSFTPGSRLQPDLPRDLETLTIVDYPHTFLHYMRARSTEDDEPPLFALKSLRLSDNHPQSYPFTSSWKENQTFADLEILVTIFPNLERLELIGHTAMEVVDLGAVTEIDGKPDSDAEYDSEAECFSYSEDEWAYNPGLHVKRKRTRQYFRKANAETYLRANLPRLQHLVFE